METADDPTPDSSSPTAEVKLELEDAIETDNCNRLEKLLGSGNNLLETLLRYEFDEDDQVTVLNVTPLALAVALGNISTVKFLLEHDAKVNAEIPDLGGTALHLAARYGPRDIVNLLLSKNAEINQRDLNGSSPLHLASRYGLCEIVTCLLDAKADLRQLDNDGCTPFHVASMFGQLEVLSLLYERGPKEQISEVNAFLNAPLHLACLNNYYDVAESLLGWGAKLYQPGSDGAIVDQLGPNGETPLYHACEEGNVKIIDMLVEHGADIHVKNDDGDTPILYSCRHLQLSSLKALLKHGASVLDVNREGNNCLHVVVSNQEPSGQAIDMISTLGSHGANIDQLNNIGYSPLRLACLLQNIQHVRSLLDWDANYDEQKSPIGETSLMTACRNPDTDIVEMLLRMGADMTPTNIHGLTALALACSSNQLENVKALVNNGATAAVRDRDGHTPLYTAAIAGHFDVALEILVTKDYFPQNPAKNKPFTERSTSVTDVRRIEGELVMMFHEAEAEYNPVPNVYYQSRYDENRHLQPIFHWAVSNGAYRLARKCISRHPQILELERSGSTWLHIASVNDNVEVSNILLETMLDQLQRAKAIIRQNSQGESPLTISIKQKYKRQHDLFLNEIYHLGTAHRDFMETNGALGSRILELLAEYETPGHEDVLKELLQKWFRDEPLGEQRSLTTLHWAVHRSQAAVVWWLLSKGGYSSGYAIENARELVPDQYPKSDVRHHIRQLLLHPPQMLARVANPNNKRTTPKPALMDGRNPVLNLQGNIVDIYATGEIVRMPYTKASVQDIIYNHGPESLMKKPKDNWEEHDLDELKKTLGQTAHDHPVRSISPQHGIDYNERFSDGMSGDFKLRWIHLPVNELEDLACRLSCDSNRSEVEHTVLMKHFDRSWAEVAAGGKRNYMKPQCVRKDAAYHENRLNNDRDSCTALYLPYLTLGVYTGKRDGTDRFNEREESIKTRNSRQIKHEPMTLDQYYYPTITNTDERDKDQVLSKFLDKQGRQSDRKILMVNQLWIWIIDEKTIITATSEHLDQEYKGNLLHTTLDTLLYSDTRSRSDRAVSVQSVMELILGVAVGLFTEKTIPTGSPERDSKGLLERKGPIEIFREAVRQTADVETRLFQNFRNGLGNKAMQQEPQSPSHIISDETELLDESRDIRDEIRILRSIAEDQDIVWKQALSPDGLKDDLQYYHPCTPTDVKKDLDEMLSEAEKMTSYVSSTPSQMTPVLS
ncbi:hypothetical protein Hte_006495 [Hypoxylon texense]